MYTEWLKMSLITLAIIAIFGIVGGLEKDDETAAHKIQLADGF